VVEIRPAAKFMKISVNAQQRDVASQLAKAVYGKGIHDCLGQGQCVRSKALTDTVFHVYSPTAKTLEGKWVSSIVASVQKHGVNVMLTLTY
jgi:hypothetical protein